MFIYMYLYIYHICLYTYIYIYYIYMYIHVRFSSMPPLVSNRLKANETGSDHVPTLSLIHGCGAMVAALLMHGGAADTRVGADAWV